MNAREQELIARLLLEHQDEIDVCFKNKEWAKLAALVRYAKGAQGTGAFGLRGPLPPSPRGIHRAPLGGGSRIDGNHVVSNAGAGIRSAGSPDYTNRNTANGNSGGNYIIPANPNYIGPIGLPATATSPWANFQ